MPKIKRNRPPTSSAVEVKLRKVVPVVPSEDEEKVQLMDDLAKMGCLGLADKPWGFKDERMVKELLGRLSNQFQGTMRGVPGQWTEEMWRATYNFRPGGLTLLSRKDEFCHGRFTGPVNPKDGYAVKDCKNDRHRRLLQFLTPILHPEKPTMLTITLGNLIFGSIVANRKMDWGRVLFDLVSGLVTRVGKSRATPLSPYLFHFYQKHQLLSETEEKSWRDHEVLLKYGESESEEEPEEETGSDEETEEEEEDKLKPRGSKRQKVTPPDGRGTPPTPNKPSPKGEEKKKSIPEPVPGDRATASGSDPEDPFTNLITILCNIRADWEVKKITLAEIGKLVDAPPDSLLPAKVAECITNPEENRKQEAELHRLQVELDALKAESIAFKDDMIATKEMAEETRKMAEKVKALFGESGMAAVKARLWDAEVLKDQKFSGTRIVRILGDFAEQVEVLMVGLRDSANRIDECSQKLAGVTISREFRMSDLSIPEFSMGTLNLNLGKDKTPQSKKSKANPTQAQQSMIDLDSSPSLENPVPIDGERNRNLSEIFNQMGPQGD